MQNKHGMQTRSAAKRLDGIHAHTNEPEFTTHSNGSAESFSSLFDGSLSSLSSSDGSSFDCSESFSDSLQPFDSTYQNLLDFMGRTNPRQARPVTPVRNAGRSQGGSRRDMFSTPGNDNPIPPPTTPRPLKRTAPQRWAINESGNLYPVVQNPARSSDPQAIRDRELKLLEQQHKDIQIRLWLGTEREDIAMEFDAENTPFRGESSSQNMIAASESSSRTPEEQRPKKLGPHGTELIDESFRAPAGEVSNYPDSWVQNQSNSLRSYPTESCL